MLEKTTDATWKKDFDRVARLSGKDRVGYPPGAGPEDRAYAGMLALLMKALEDEAERAGVSHDAGRQLLFASGLLPRGVAVPEWAQFGMGSFFETPMHSPWPTPTGPSSQYLTLYRVEMGDKGKRFEGDAYKTMHKIVTDGYFRGLTAEELKKESPERLKARAATWALVYFLAQKKRDNLMHYFSILKEMPRDLELDDATLWACFARAFDAYDPATKQVNEAKMGNVAATWQSFMPTVQLESQDLVNELQKTYDEINNPKDETQPGRPPAGPGPGGIPPP